MASELGWIAEAMALLKMALDDVSADLSPDDVARLGYARGIAEGVRIRCMAAERPAMRQAGAGRRAMAAAEDAGRAARAGGWRPPSELGARRDG